MINIIAASLVLLAIALGLWLIGFIAFVTLTARGTIAPRGDLGRREVLMPWRWGW